ncbi:histidine--tRNA ligase [Sesbania bispinosa]|nr:histidine--tRNA ligase [Sesbania bispinosa]
MVKYQMLRLAKYFETPLLLGVVVEEDIRGVFQLRIEMQNSAITVSRDTLMEEIKGAICLCSDMTHKDLHLHMLNMLNVT